jgi:type I restriction enzyme, S subunit
VIASDKAVTMGHIRRGDLDEALVPVPSQDALTAARLRADPMDEMRAALRRENDRLGRLRDALLPKLVTGNLRVAESYDPDAVLGSVGEKIAAAA